MSNSFSKQSRIAVPMHISQCDTVTSVLHAPFALMAIKLKRWVVSKIYTESSNWFWILINIYCDLIIERWWIYHVRGRGWSAKDRGEMAYAVSHIVCSSCVIRLVQTKSFFLFDLLFHLLKWQIKSNWCSDTTYVDHTTSICCLSNVCVFCQIQWAWWEILLIQTLQAF